MNMDGDRNNKFWPQGKSTSDWQNQDFLCAFKCTMNSLAQAPSSGNDRAQPCSCYCKIHWRISTEDTAGDQGSGRERRNQTTSARCLGETFSLAPSDSHTSSAESRAHYTSIPMDLNMINSNLHPYIRMLCLLALQHFQNFLQEVVWVGPETLQITFSQLFNQADCDLLWHTQRMHNFIES